MVKQVTRGLGCIINFPFDQLICEIKVAEERIAYGATRRAENEIGARSENYENEDGDLIYTVYMQYFQYNCLPLQLSRRTAAFGQNLMRSYFTRRAMAQQTATPSSHGSAEVFLHLSKQDIFSNAKEH